MPLRHSFHFLPRFCHRNYHCFSGGLCFAYYISWRRSYNNFHWLTLEYFRTLAEIIKMTSSSQPKKIDQFIEGYFISLKLLFSFLFANISLNENSILSNFRSKLTQYFKPVTEESSQVTSEESKNCLCA